MRRNFVEKAKEIVESYNNRRSVLFKEQKEAKELLAKIDADLCIVLGAPSRLEDYKKFSNGECPNCYITFNEKHKMKPVSPPDDSGNLDNHIDFFRCSECDEEIEVEA